MVRMSLYLSVFNQNIQRFKKITLKRYILNSLPHLRTSRTGGPRGGRTSEDSAGSSVRGRSSVARADLAGCADSDQLCDPGMSLTPVCSPVTEAVTPKQTPRAVPSCVGVCCAGCGVCDAYAMLSVFKRRADKNYSKKSCLHYNQKNTFIS